MKVLILTAALGLSACATDGPWFHYSSGYQPLPANRAHGRVLARSRPLITITSRRAEPLCPKSEAVEPKLWTRKEQ